MGYIFDCGETFSDAVIPYWSFISFVPAYGNYLVEYFKPRCEQERVGGAP
jgi:hypothetical protein